MKEKFKNKLIFFSLPKWIWVVFVLPNYRFFHVFCPLCIKVDSFGTVCYLFHDCSRTLQDSFMECYSTKYFSEKYYGCIQIFFDCVYTNIIIMSLLVRKQRATLYKLFIVELWFFISVQIFIGLWFYCPNTQSIKSKWKIILKLN